MMGAYLDIEDVCSGNPKAMQELADLRAKIARFEAALDKMKMDSPDFARGFNAGREVTLRRNPSGCCCKYSEDDTKIISLCADHEELIEKYKAAMVPIREAWNNYWKVYDMGREATQSYFAELPRSSFNAIAQSIKILEEQDDHENHGG